MSDVWLRSGLAHIQSYSLGDVRCLRAISDVWLHAVIADIKLYFPFKINKPPKGTKSMCQFSSLYRNSNVHPGVIPPPPPPSLPSHKHTHWHTPSIRKLPLGYTNCKHRAKKWTELRYRFAFCLTASIPDTYMNVKSGIPGKKKLSVVDLCTIQGRI